MSEEGIMSIMSGKPFYFRENRNDYMQVIAAAAATTTTTAETEVFVQSLKWKLSTIQGHQLVLKSLVSFCFQT